MKRFVKKTKLLQMILVGIMLVLMVGVVFAAPLIDHFDTGSLSSFNVSGPSASNFSAQAGGIGGERDVLLTSTASSTGSATAGVNVTAGRLVLGNDGTSETSLNVQWDGSDNSSVLVPGGLGSIDFTATSANQGILLSIEGNDFPANVSLTFHQALATSSSYSFVSPGGIIVGSHVDIFVPFSSFSNPAIFSDVGSVELNMNNIGLSREMDISIGFLEANPPSRDFGDFDPLNYPIASHQLTNGVRLGPSVDGETQNNNPGGDNFNDGLVFKTGLANPAHGGWTEGTVDLNQGGSFEILNAGPTSKRVQLFMDFTQTGTLSPVSLYADSFGSLVPIGNNPSLPPGATQVWFDVPANTFDSQTNPIPTRVRISTAGGLTASGIATDGEVEDYVWNFGPTAVNLQSFSADTPVSPVVYVVMAFATLVLIGGVAFVLRREQENA